MIDLETRDTGELTRSEVRALGALFDAEYEPEFGPWSLEAPYGYSPARIRVLAFEGARLVGHVGFQPRPIAAGDREVVVGGTGGVLVSEAARGQGLGARLMRQAQAAMLDAGVEFGYLGCRPAVVPFYLAAGWHRIRARERHRSRTDPSAIAESEDSPLLICAATRRTSDWPAGDIDLRGPAW